MPYTNRQLQCLEAIGIVPWVLRNSTAVPVSLPAETGTAVAESASIGEAEFPATTGLTTLLPDDLAQLSAALPGNAIAAFNIRGTWQNCLGSRDATVLVIVQPPNGGAETTELPLNNHEAQLLEQMLRAIGLTRRDILQCVLQTNGEGAEASGEEAAEVMNSETVETLSGGSIRAVLLLQAGISHSEVATEHQFAFGNSLPAWRLPHPALLLNDPIRKRQAWQILKALRCTLAATS